MSHADWLALSAPFAVLFLGVILAGIGWMLRRVIREADAGHVERIRRIERDVSGMGLRYDEGFRSLDDLIRTGFERAAEDRSDIAQRLARIEGHLGWPNALRNGTHD